MRVILSPAKTMRAGIHPEAVADLPVFRQDAVRIRERIRNMSEAEAAALWKCSDPLAALNCRRFAEMDLEKGLTPAVYAYDGMQYRHIAAAERTAAEMAWLQAHVRILSGFYGILKPLDGVAPYRLEMQSRLAVDGCRDLYAFWGPRLYEALAAEDRVILNLASAEYARSVEPWLHPGDRFITVEFASLSAGLLKRMTTYAKMARGEMVRFLAERQSSDPEDVIAFRGLGFAYSKEHSSADCMVFVTEAPAARTKR
jgi:cytoplasmic iron level regulating protein YaaA (DUF328/UPF0246 family)